MADPAGLTLGIIGLAGIFTTCVDCFEYIQFGRNFGKDFSNCVLRLSIVKLKLSRWGAAVDVSTKTGPPKDEKEIEAKDILAAIMQQFASAEKKSLRFKGKAKTDDVSLVVYNNATDVEPSIESLRRKAVELAEQRQKRTSLAKKTAWALYEKKAFEELIGSVKGFVDDLVDLFPATQESQREMSITEASEFAKIEDGKALPVLKEAIGDGDEILLDSLVAKMKLMSKGGHTWGEVDVTDDGTLHQGDELGPGQTATGSRHNFGKTKVSGQAIVSQGDRVGMEKDFMELALAARAQRQAKEKLANQQLK